MNIYSETCTNGHLCKLDTSLLRTFSPFIFHYILCLKYTCYYGHLSNAYNRQMICAQEALIRLNEPVYKYGRLIKLARPGLTSKEAMFV